MEARPAGCASDRALPDGTESGAGSRRLRRAFSLDQPHAAPRCRRQHRWNKLGVELTDLGERELQNITHPCGSIGSKESRTSTAGLAQPHLTWNNRPSIAVMPFKNLGGDPQEAYSGGHHRGHHRRPGPQPVPARHRAALHAPPDTRIQPGRGTTAPGLPRRPGYEIVGEPSGADRPDGAAHGQRIGATVGIGAARGRAGRRRDANLTSPEQGVACEP
jgi:hypothetical protein